MAEKTLESPLTEANWSVLGLLRFVLAFSVMITHADNIVPERIWTHVFPRFGAVAAFFMISGYSISASHAARPDGFLRRRILRIYPLSVLTALASIACLYLMGGSVDTMTLGIVHVPTPAETISILLLANGLFYATPFLLHPFWSLDCEVLYYIFAPWILTRSTRLLKILFVLSAFLHFIPVDGVYLRVYPQAVFGQGAVSMLWAWLLGVFAFRFPSDRFFTVLAALGCNVLLVVHNHDNHILTSLIFAIVAVCVFHLQKIRLPQRMVQMGNYLGELSYPLYLVHFPVTLMLGHILLAKVAPLIDVQLCWTASLLLSIGLYEFVDQPIRRQRGILKSATPLDSLVVEKPID